MSGRPGTSDLVRHWSTSIPLWRCKRNLGADLLNMEGLLQQSTNLLLPGCESQRTGAVLLYFGRTGGGRFLWVFVSKKRDPKAISVCFGVRHPLLLSKGKFGCRWLRSSKSFWLGRRTLLKHCEGLQLQHVTCFWSSCIKTCVNLSSQVTNPMEPDMGEQKKSSPFGRMDDRWHIRLALMWFEALTRMRFLALRCFANFWASLDVGLRWTMRANTSAMRCSLRLCWRLRTGRKRPRSGLPPFSFVARKLHLLQHLQLKGQLGVGTVDMLNWVFHECFMKGWWIHDLQPSWLETKVRKSVSCVLLAQHHKKRIPNGSILVYKCINS